MKLKLSQVQSTGTGNWSEVEELGTVADNLENGDKVRFVDTNLKGDGLVTLFVTPKGKENEAPLMLPCSKKLSVTIRAALAKGTAKKAVVAALLELRVISNEIGHFIIPPFGGSDEGFTVNDLKKEKTSFEDIAVF